MAIGRSTLGLLSFVVCSMIVSTAWAQCEGGAPDGVFNGGAGEECDDGNATAGDGCDDQCATESGWFCDEPANSTTSSCNRGPMTNPILVWEAVCTQSGATCDTGTCNVSTTVDTESSVSDPDGDDIAGNLLCVHDPAGVQDPFMPTDFTFEDPWNNGMAGGTPDFDVVVTPNDPCAPSCYEMAYNVPDEGFPDVDSGDEQLIVCYNDPPTLTPQTGATAPSGTVTITGSDILTATSVNVIDGGLDPSSIAVSSTENGTYGATAASEDGGICSIVGGDLVYTAPNSAADSPDHCWVRICETNPGPNVLCDMAEFEFTITGCANDAECTEATAPLCNLGTGVCEPCSADAQCLALDAANPVCNTDGSCVECTAANDGLCPGVCNDMLNVCDPCVMDSDCTDIAIPICDTMTGICVTCLVDGDCAGQICNVNTNVCEPCVDDSQCGAMTPRCDTGGAGTCVGCLDDNDCDGEICDGTTNTCGPCTDDADCAMHPDGNVCDTDICVQCADDGDCPNNGRCDSGNTCQECIVDEHCDDPTPVCFANSCVAETPECTTNADCTNASLPICDNGTCVADTGGRGGLAGGSVGCAVAWNTQRSAVAMLFAMVGVLVYARRRRR